MSGGSVMSKQALSQKQQSSKGFKDFVPEEKFSFKTVVLIVLLAVLAALSESMGNRGYRLLPTVDSVMLPSRLGFLAVLILGLVGLSTGRLQKLLKMRIGRAEMATAYAAGALMLVIGGFQFINGVIDVAAKLAIGIRYIPNSHHPQYISGLLVPDVEAITSGYLVGNASVPWAAWIGPLFFWFLIFAPMFFLIYAMSSLFYHFWGEEEHIAFPLVEPVVALAEIMERKPESEYTLRNKPFLIGVAIPFILGLLNIGHYFFQGIPTITMEWDLGQFFTGGLQEAIGAWPGTYLRIWPAVVGIGYLAPTDFAFSIWFFYYLIHPLGAGIMQSMGHVTFTRKVWEGMFLGGTVGLLITLTWFAWPRIREYFGAAFGRYTIDPQKMPMPPKLLVGGFLISLIMIFVLGKTMLSISPIWMFLHLLFFLGYSIAYARLQAEAGMPFTQGSPWTATDFVKWFGSGPIPDGTRYGLRFISLNQTYGIPATTGRIVESFKFADWANMSRRNMLWYMMIAFVVIFVIGSVVFLSLSYSKGAAVGLSKPFGDTIARDPLSATLGGLNEFWWVPVGTLLVVVFSVLRARYVWWPFHPLGFLASSQVDLGYRLPGSFLVAWFFKVIIVRYGGAKLYKTMRPLFVGLVISNVSMDLLGVLVRCIDLAVR
jgi:hypothetical protein